jgi:hypothetical protein
MSKKPYVERADMVEKAFYSPEVQKLEPKSTQQRAAFRDTYDKLIREGRDTEQDKLDEARKVHEKRFQRTLFMVAAPVGFIALVVGSFLSLAPVGTGLMFGGIFTFVEGSVCQWSVLDDWMKFALLLVVFVTLIFIGYRKVTMKEAVG